MKIVRILLVSLLLTLGAFIPNAFASYSTAYAWDQNSEPDLAGYYIHYKTNTSGPPYDGTDALEGPSPVRIPLSSLSDPQNPSYTLHFPSDGKTVYSVCTAYDIYDNESDYSNELEYIPSPSSPYDDIDNSYSSYLTASLPGNDGIDRNNGIININVPSLASNPKTYFIEKSGLTLDYSQVLGLSFDAKVLSGTDVPISVYALDKNQPGEVWIAEERMVFLNTNFERFTIPLISNEYSNNVSFKIVIGHAVGDYEFTNFSINPYYPVIMPLKNVFFNRYITAGKAKFIWEPFSTEPAVDARIVKIFKTYSDFLAGTSDKEYSYSPSDLSTEILINDPSNGYAYRNGIYFAVYNDIGGEESLPVLYGFLPGNVDRYQGDQFNSLMKQIVVNGSDIIQATQGFIRLWRVDLPILDDIGDMKRRIDWDANTLAGRYQDRTFIMTQNGKTLQ